MARPTDKERVGAWDKRISTASKQHREWADEFDCDILEQMYYGHQWANEEDDFDQKKYVINLFYPAINISKPSMLFSIPKFKVTPRPNRTDDPLSNVELRAKLQEYTLNSFVQDPKLGFEMETGLGLLDSQFRFGVAYIGYTADFMDNPNAGKPVLKDNQEPLIDSEGNTVAQANVSVKSEQLFVKWISGIQFRVSSNATNRIQNADWCGYYEWHRIDDIKANPRYKNTSNLLPTGKMKDQESEAGLSEEQRNSSGMVKVWFLWDNRAKKRFVFASGGEKLPKLEPG